MIKSMLYIVLLGLTAAETFAAGPSPKLERSAWHIVTINGKSVERDPRIEFGQGRFAGSSGCNGFSGSYTQGGPALVVKEFMATEMGCGQKLNRQEQEVFALLGPKVRLRFGRDGLLYLSNGKNAAVLRRAATCSICNPQPAPLPLPSLAGKSWAIVSINKKPVSFPQYAVISFTKDRFAATVGCNRMGGGYRIGKVEYIVTSHIAQTRRACVDDVAAEESAFGTLISDDPWMERVSKPGEPIRIRLSSGRNEALIVER